MYYEEKQIIARCDRNGNILGPIERWEAHKKGILHRAFTLGIFFNESFILQHRKHPVFDGVFDLTSSSHQLYDGNKLQDTLDAANITLRREWHIKEGDIAHHPKIEGAIYYKAQDPKSIYVEHELCDIVSVRVKNLPTPNYKYSYGYSIVEKHELLDKGSRIYPLLAPWVKKMIEEKFI